MVELDTDDSLLGRRIREAYAAVVSAGIAEEALKLEAFRFALQASSEMSGVDLKAQSGMANATHIVGPDLRDGLDGLMAKEIDVPQAVIEMLYDIRGDDVSLNIPIKALPTSVSAAMREIAVILSVGRKYAGIGAGGTSFDTIRKACDEHGKLDRKNFAVAMTSLKPRLAIAGKGSEKLLVPKKPADEMAKDILLRYYQSVA